MYWNIWQVACWNRPTIVNCDFNRVLELRLLWAVAQCIPCVFVFPKIALSKNNTKNSKQQHHRMFEHYESQIIVAYCGHIFIWCQNLWNYHLWGKIKRPSYFLLWLWVPRNTKRTTPPEGLFAHRLLRALQVVASLRRQAGHQGLPRTDLDRCGPQGLPGVLG